MTKELTESVKGFSNVYEMHGVGCTSRRSCEVHFEDLDGPYHGLNGLYGSGKASPKWRENSWTAQSRLKGQRLGYGLNIFHFQDGLGRCPRPVCQ